MSVFTGETSKGHYGWSFILGWIGTVLAGIAGVIGIVMGLVMKRNTSAQPQQPVQSTLDKAAPSSEVVDPDPDPAPSSQVDQTNPNPSGHSKW